MKITERAQLAALMIVQAHELTDARQIGQALHEAESLLFSLLADINKIRESYDGQVVENLIEVLGRTKDLTKSEEASQNERMRRAQEHNPVKGVPSGIRNY